VARIVWDGTSEHVAETLLAQTSAEAKDQRATAKEFLVKVLGEGPMDSAKVLAHAEALDLKRSTVWRARKEIGVVARKSGFAGGWMWELRNAN
jgi:putative DNA primase/helicase